jgi:thioredoxin reductase (NADPH)
MLAPPSRTAYDVASRRRRRSGLAAAVYASDGLSTVLLARDLPGGRPAHVGDRDFRLPAGSAARAGQTRGAPADAGTEIVFRGVVGDEHWLDGTHRIAVDGGHEVSAPIVVAAPGMDWRRLEVERVDELLGRGVYYGAGRSEALQCGGDDVLVVGAGNSAGQAVLNLANAGARVKMIVRGERLGKTMSAYLVERIEHHPLIDVRYGAAVDALHADAELEAVTVEGPDGAQRPRALFICIGGQRASWAARGSPDAADTSSPGPTARRHAEGGRSIATARAETSRRRVRRRRRAPRIDEAAEAMARRDPARSRIAVSTSLPADAGVSPRRPRSPRRTRSASPAGR